MELEAPSTVRPQVAIRQKKKAITGFGVAMLFVLAFAMFFALNFKTVVVSGPSMLPTLKSGQRVLVSKAYWLVGSMRKGDVVVISDDGPTGFIIKRIYRTGGETVDWGNAPESHKLVDGEFKVPEGDLYVLGDNREYSEDSRKFGPVETSAVLGKVIVWQ